MILTKLLTHQPMKDGMKKKENNKDQFRMRSSQTRTLHIRVLHDPASYQLPKIVT